LRWLIGFLPSGISATMLAQSSDPLSGGAGWVGAGLLGLVLGWMFLKHLPDKDKQLKELIEAKDKALEAKDAQILTMWTRHREQLGEFQAEARANDQQRREEFKAALQQVAAHCEKDMGVMTSTLVVELRHLAERIERPERPEGKP
jgi:hypothetical protein